MALRLSSCRGLRCGISLFAALLVAFWPGRAALAQSLVSTVLGPGLRVTGTTATPVDLEPMAVALDAAGNLYTADNANCTIWKTSFSSGAASTSLFAGEVGTCKSPASPVATNPTMNPLAHPTAVAACGEDIYFATRDDGGVFEVDPNGNFTLLGLQPTNPQSQPAYPVALACSTDSNNVDHVWVSSYWISTAQTEMQMSGELDELSPNGGDWTTNSLGIDNTWQLFTAIAVNPADNNLYGIDTNVDGYLAWDGPKTFKPGGVVLLANTAASNPTGIGTGVGTYTIYGPSGLAADSAGDLLLSMSPVVSPPDTPVYSSEVAEIAHTHLAFPVLAGTGTLGFVDDVPGSQAEFDSPQGLVVDASGNIYVADALNNRVRLIHPLSSGPTGLTLVTPDQPRQSSTYGYQQSVLNPSTGLFYYTATSNTVNAVGSGANLFSANNTRIVSVIPVGAAHAGGSYITLIADPTRNLIYANNSYDGKLYVIDGAANTTSTDSTAYQVIGSVALNNRGANLLAIDIALNRIYVAGPNANSLSVVQGGASPQLLQNIGSPASDINSMAVDPGTHAVYAVSDAGAGPAGQEESFITVSYDATTGSQSATSGVFPIDEDILAANFIGSSLAFDGPSGSLLVSGAASADPEFTQTFEMEDFFELPQLVTVSALFNFPPIASSLDFPDRTLYVTDFDGSDFDPSSNVAAIYGLDAHALSSTAIPVFGTSSTPSSPHVFDVEPDSSADQAWISASDAAGGFVEIWDAQSSTIALSTPIPRNGGGYLTVDSTAHAAYLMDDVNELLYLVNTLPWTPTPYPSFSQQGNTVTITAANSDDLIYYNTVNAPGWYFPDTGCSSPCQVPLTAPTTTIHAIEGGFNTPATLPPSDDVMGVFTASTSLTDTRIAMSVSPNPALAHQAVTLTAKVTAVSGTAIPAGNVSFLNGSKTLGTAALSASGDATWTASFPSAGVDSITASYGGNSSFAASTSSATTLTVNLPPVLQLSVSQIDFPATAVKDSSAGQKIVLTNLGPGALGISGITVTAVANRTSSPQSFPIANHCGSMLAVNATCTVSVEFSPLVSGTLSAAVVFNDSAFDSPQTVTVSGTAFSGPRVVFSPASLTFPDTLVGAKSAAQTVTVTNIGNQPATVSGFSVSGSAAAKASFGFVGVTCAVKVRSLAPNQSCTASFDFDPQAAGIVTLTVDFSIGSSVQSYTLSGTGIGGPWLTVSPNALSFPDTQIGKTSTALTVTLANIGNKDADVSNLKWASGSAFALAKTTCTKPLPKLLPGKSCTLSFDFTPTVKGSPARVYQAFNGVLEVLSNATNGSQTISFSGNGYVGPVIEFSPASLDFPVTAVGSMSAAMKVTVTNAGSGVLSLGSLGLTGADPGSFEIGGTCGQPVGSGKSCTLSVTFAPKAEGELSANLPLKSNAVNDTGVAGGFVINLTGTGN
jgi:hypothetical protein